jgi:hypothetical protein
MSGRRDAAVMRKPSRLREPGGLRSAVAERPKAAHEHPSRETREGWCGRRSWAVGPLAGIGNTYGAVRHNVRDIKQCDKGGLDRDGQSRSVARRRIVAGVAGSRLDDIPRHEVVVAADAVTETEHPTLSGAATAAFNGQQVAFGQRSHRRRTSSIRRGRSG